MASSINKLCSINELMEKGRMHKNPKFSRHFVQTDAPENKIGNKNTFTQGGLKQKHLVDHKNCLLNNLL